MFRWGGLTDRTFTSEKRISLWTPGHDQCPFIILYILQLFLYILCLTVIEKVPHWTRSFQLSLFPNVRIIGTHSYVQFFTWMPGIQTQVLLLAKQVLLGTEPSWQHTVNRGLLTRWGHGSCCASSPAQREGLLPYRGNGVRPQWVCNSRQSGTQTTRPPLTS